MTSDSQQWDELQRLFDLADGVPTEDREPLLAEVCPDAELRQRVMALLRAAERTQRRKPDEGIRIGPYPVLKLIGSGGVGSVYLARRPLAGATQLVALKVLAPHALVRGFAERFEREQRILAGLDHPNITRLIDVGLSESGQAYMVTEYIEGQHLDSYCAEKKLGLDQRLALFGQVCAAVDYAHRNLIIHLDLKPSNILVTPGGQAKLLDFGTAKLVTQDGSFTATIMATPAYASPEQLRHEPPTTASDVYSLGVVLYELVVGERPPEKRPLTIPNHLPPDLATIIMKCLADVPGERYGSVSSLWDDLTRFREGRPILARPQTTLYHLTKFLKRNQGKATAAALLLIAATGAGAWAWHQQQRAVEEGQRALRMQTFLYRLFQTANSNITGKPAATVQEFLRMGETVLPKYIHDPQDLREARLGLAESMYQNRDFEAARGIFADIMRNAHKAGDLPTEAEATAYACNIDFQQGKQDQALALCSHALALANRPGVPARTLALAAMFTAANRADHGLQRDPETLRIAELAVNVSRSHGLPPHETAQAVEKLGEIQQNLGNLEKAKALYEEALKDYQQDSLALCDEGDIYFGLAGVTKMSGKLVEAVPLYREAVRVYQTCLGPNDRETLRLGASYAGSLVDAGRASEAVTLLERALPTWQKVFEPGAPPWREFRHFLALAYLGAHRFTDAENVERENLDLLLKQGLNPTTDRIVGYSHFQLAQALQGEGNNAEALLQAKAAEKILAPTTVSKGAQKLLADVRQLISELSRRAAK